MATIHDVARVAGVSISTVSYALSGKRSITAATRARIDRAVAELGYRPNAGARMLAGSRTSIIALTAPMHGDTHPPALMSFVLAVVTAARSYDYDVLLLTQDDSLSGLRRVASSSLVDGIVMMDVAVEDERVPVLRDLDLPSALIGIPHETAGLTCVDLDFEAAADLAVGRLVDLGHESVGMLGHSQHLYDRGSNFAPRFRDGYLAAGAARGIRTAFHTTESTREAVTAALDAVRAELPDLSALVLNCNENVHSILLELLRERGVRVPEDLSLVSACSSFPTDHLVPPLDVIPLPAADQGRRAVELLMERLDGRGEPHVELIPPEYRPLGSTAAPAARDAPAPAPATVVA
ncbi:LacI family transcriptional regulator [Clavibacter michiganensis]|uniref:LacI family transcriptional regulator n=1 Tax=Clavibacter michiganensis TaxID=28447 RepID=A0A2S5VS18_9MICO|nr:LacI family DNA-binding transcriptional regulator [Clavibacter michiganensis]PPF66437.1 LacI family transcriptional regulator [Clavibacter michiganensis]